MPMMTRDEFDQAKRQKAVWAQEMAVLKDGVASLRKATAGQYADFLIQCLRDGGKINYTYNYPFANSDTLIATKSVSIPKGCGANSINVIVPKGIEVTRVGGHESENPGIRKIGSSDHGSSYCMGLSGCHAPIYSDVAKIMMTKGWRFEKSEFGGNTDKHDVECLVGGDWPSDGDEDDGDSLARRKFRFEQFRAARNSIECSSLPLCIAVFLAFIAVGWWAVGFTPVLALMLAGLAWAVWPKAKT